MTQAKIQLAIDGVATVVGGLRQVGDKVGDVTKSIGGLATLGGALSVATVSAWVKSSVDSLAELDDMAQKTGASVENLSKLQKVAIVFDQNFGEVDAALVKLAKGMADTDEESSKVQRALTSIGVSARDASGQLRDPAEVMVDLAKKLQNYKDDANKAALMNAILGKSGAQLLPYFNDLAENVDKYGGESAESAAQASLLKDQMGEMWIRSAELSNAIAVELLPGMVQITKAMTEAAKEGSLLKTVWVGLGGLGAAIFTDEFAEAPVKIANINGELAILEARKNKLNAAPVTKIFGEGFHSDEIDKIDKRIAEITARRAGLQKSIQDALKPPVQQPDKPSAPPLSSTDKPDKPPKNIAEKISDYEKLTRSIHEKTAAEQAEITVGQALSEAEKIRTKMYADLENGAIKMNDAQVSRANADLFVLEVIEQTNAARKDSLKFQQEAIASANQAAADALREAEANETLAATWGMNRSEIEAYELARLESRLGQKESLELTEEETRALERQIAAKRRSVDSLRQIDIADAAKQAADKQAEENKRIEQELTDSISDGIMNGFRDGTRVRDIFLREMQAQFAKTILRPGIEYVVSGGKSGGGGFLGDIIGGIAGIFGGGGYTGGSIADLGAGVGVKESFASFDYANPFSLAELFADGAAFTNGIVSKPTAFNMGLMGESGPEAIMPLTRASDGSLGVKAAGGGKSVTLHNTVSIHVDSRTDRSEVYAIVERAVQSGNAQLLDRMEREGI